MELASCRARFIGTPFGLAMKPRCRRGQQRLGGHAGANVGIPGPTRIKPEAAAPLFPPDNSMSPWIASCSDTCAERKHGYSEDAVDW